MKHIKKVEEIGKQLGYESTDCQYAATVGCLSAKLEIVYNDIERLWERPGLDMEDMRHTLLSIQQCLEDVMTDEG